jgi:hypothetical protein
MQQSNYGVNESRRERLTGAMDEGIVISPIAAMLDDSLVGVSAMVNDNVGCLGSTPPPLPLTSPVSPDCALAVNPTRGHDCESPLCCLDRPIGRCKSWCSASLPSGTHHMCPLQSQPLSPQCWLYIVEDVVVRKFMHSRAPSLNPAR